MEKSNKIGSEITVRISLTFQDAPDVHTLLAMTPVRERGKLVRLALERYIAATDHPAGNVEAQIAAVSEWLRSRSSTHGADPASECHHSSPQVIPKNIARKEPTESVAQPPIRTTYLHAESEMINPGQKFTAVDEIENTSVRRWLTG